MSDFYSTDPAFKYNPFKYDTLVGQLDPFVGTVTQTHRLRAYCQIMVGGVDITDKLQPHLISVKIYDGSPEKFGELEIDDRDGKMPLPPLFSPVIVALGWQSESMVRVFHGVIDSFEHGFGRKQGGRRMYVHVKGLDQMNTRAKEPMQDNLGEGAKPGQVEGEMKGMTEWVNQMAKNSGIIPQISGALSRIKQDYWSQSNESFMHTVQTMADKFGFVHQFSEGNKLTIKEINEGGISCHATWRDNLISWRVRPFAPRASFKGSKQQWYSSLEGAWKQADQKFGLKGIFGGAAAQNMPQAPAATETNAGNENQGQQADADLQQGNGRIIINGEPKAQWATRVLLTGARPGIDGIYWIVAVEHNYSRHGFITTLEVRPVANAPDQYNVGTPFDLPRPAPNQ
jgi:hypothetical protein